MWNNFNLHAHKFRQIWIAKNAMLCKLVQKKGNKI